MRMKLDFSARLFQPHWTGADSTTSTSFALNQHQTFSAYRQGLLSFFCQHTRVQVYSSDMEAATWLGGQGISSVYIFFMT